MANLVVMMVEPEELEETFQTEAKRTTALLMRMKRHDDDIGELYDALEELKRDISSESDTISFEASI